MILLARAGASPIVCFEPSPVRRALALSCGADHGLSPVEDAEKAWSEATGLVDGPTRVIDAAGNQLGAAVALAAPRGQLLAIGYNNLAPCVLSQQLLVEKDLRIIGTTGTDYAFVDAVDLLDNGVLDLSPVVTGTVQLDDFDSALDQLRSAQAGKIQVTFD